MHTLVHIPRPWFLYVGMPSRLWHGFNGALVYGSYTYLTVAFTNFTHDNNLCCLPTCVVAEEDCLHGGTASGLQWTFSREPLAGRQFTAGTLSAEVRPIYAIYSNTTRPQITGCTTTRPGTRCTDNHHHPLQYAAPATSMSSEYPWKKRLTRAASRRGRSRGLASSLEARDIQNGVGS